MRPASSPTSGYIGRRGELVETYRQEDTTLQEKSELQKERETKDDGRYIIFYTFEDEED
jgi:hypothetical protein